MINEKKKLKNDEIEKQFRFYKLFQIKKWWSKEHGPNLKEKQIK